MDTALIEDCIARADRCESKLDEGPLSVGGYTSVKIRHLLNNLGAISTGYFEVGSHLGATYISTCYKNELELAGGFTACDNFCEFNEEGRTKQQFTDNCNKYLARHSLMEMDCWKIDKLYDHHNTDLYLYDGAHDFHSQARGVAHFARMMAPEFIMLVDDAAWDPVYRGTKAGIEMAHLEVAYEKLLWSGKGGDGAEWWNGFLVLVLKR